MTGDSAPVSEEEVRRIIREWGRLHDLQAGLSAFLPLIAEEGFFMRFGEKAWVGYADFEEHQMIKRKFFDEIHEYLAITVTPGDPTRAHTRMRWICRHRPAGSPRSQIIKALLEHTWEFRRCLRTGRPFLQGHAVDHFVYEEGFAPDDRQEVDPHLDPRWGAR